MAFIAYVEGSYFGDNDIINHDSQEGRDSTAIAETECNLLVLQRKDFLQLADDFEEIGKDMRIIANSRKTYHEQLITEVHNKVKHLRDLEEGGSSNGTSMRSKMPRTGSDYNLFNNKKKGGSGDKTGSNRNVDPLG